jgi:chromosome segregation ATPase
MRARAEALLASHLGSQKIAMQEQASKFMADAQLLTQERLVEAQKREDAFRAKEREIIDAAEKRFDQLREDFEEKANGLKSKCHEEKQRADDAEQLVTRVKEEAARNLQAFREVAHRETATRVDEVNESFKNEVARLRKTAREAEAAARDAEAAQESETMSMSQSLRLLRENVTHADRRAEQLQGELTRRKNEEDRAINAVTGEKERLEAEVSRIKALMTEAKEEKHDLQLRLDQTSEKLDSTSKAYTHVESKLRKASDEIITLEAKATDASVARDAALASASASEARQKLAAAHWDEERTILTERSKSEIFDLQRRISYLQESLDTASSDAAAREEKYMNDLDAARLNTEERERRVATADRQRLEADVARLGVKVVEQQERENSLRRSYDTKETALQDTVEALREKTRQLKTLAREELRGLAEMVRTGEAREKAASEALQACQKRLLDLERENQALTEQMRQLQEGEQSQKAGMDAMRTTHTAVEARLQHATDRMESLAAKLAAAQAAAESEASRARAAAAQLDAVKHDADMREKNLQSQIDVLETRHAEIESKLNAAQRAAAFMEAEKKNPRESTEVTRLKLANMRAEAKIVTLSDDLNASNMNHAEKQERADRELRAQRQEVRRLEAEAGKLVRERAERSTLVSELEKARGTLRRAKESHDQVRHENVILASEAERIVERMASQQHLEKEALQRNADEAREELSRTRAELQRVKGRLNGDEFALAESDAALRASQLEASRARAEAKYALREREQEANRVAQEEGRVRELEIAMRQSEQSNQYLGSEVGRLDSDKARLERSIREREILSRRVKQELNDIRGDFHRFLHASKTYGPGADAGGGSESFVDAAALVTPAGRDPMHEMKLTAEDLINGQDPDESSATQIEVSRRGSIHIHRSGGRTQGGGVV